MKLRKKQAQKALKKLLTNLENSTKIIMDNTAI